MIVLTEETWKNAQESAKSSLAEAEMIRVQAEMLLKRSIEELKQFPKKKNASLSMDKGDKGQG